MSHYRLADSMPSAIILARNPRTSSLDELKTYQGNEIFLNNGDEFQIRLFNPLTDKIGAEVSINGKKSEHLLVLNPGEDVTIDRFLDEQRRMIFETYQYDQNNQAARKAVVNNGIVEIKFFKEFYPFYNGYTYTTYSNPFITLCGSTSSTTTFTDGNSWNHTLTSGNMAMNMLSDFNTVYTCSCDMTPEFKSPDVPMKEVDRSITGNNKLLKETGRVSKGEQSLQNFENVAVQFDTNHFHRVIYYLKPMSERNSMTKEIREYCSQCSYRVRNNNWVYCPKCGNKLY